MRESYDDFECKREKESEREIVEERSGKKYWLKWKQSPANNEVSREKKFS